METASLLGLKIHKINVEQLLARVVASIKEQKQLKIFHLNIHAFNIAFTDKHFAYIINKGDLVFCDGYGVKIGAKILGEQIGQRMTPPDWIDDLCLLLKEQNFSLFLLGDEPGVANRCAEQWMRKYPELKIAGAHHGFFDKEGRENEEVLAKIRQANPDVLLVGFGMPLQEKWIMENAEKLNTCVFISVGAMFRWVTGIEKRAPSFLSSNGFEGIFRLFVQPRKVWRRYILEVPFFFYKVLLAAISKKARVANSFFNCLSLFVALPIVWF